MIRKCIEKKELAVFESYTEFEKHFYLGRDLGNGAFAEVSECRYLENREEIYAIKKFSEEIYEDSDEIKILKTLKDCEGSVRLVGIVKEGKKFVKGLIFKHYLHNLRDYLDT